MRFDVLTLFPELFHSYLQQSLLKLAIEKQLVDVCCGTSAIGRRIGTSRSMTLPTEADREC